MAFHKMRRLNSRIQNAFRIAVGCASLLAGAAVFPDDETRRSEISAKGKVLFKNTTNHCKSFTELGAFAAGKTNNVGNLIEDLKLVLIGESLTRRGTGKHYIGNTPGARGDSGFKRDLKDGSPQVEHAFAAIYIGKTMPPGSTEALALMTEVAGPLVGGGKLNAADVLLYAIGGDIGQRLSGSNFRQFPDVITRTMCE